MITSYKGWKVYYVKAWGRPEAYVAERHGVTINTTTRDGIVRMIDHKVAESKRPLFK